MFTYFLFLTWHKYNPSPCMKYKLKALQEALADMNTIFSVMRVLGRSCEFVTLTCLLHPVPGGPATLKAAAFPPQPSNKATIHLLGRKAPGIFGTLALGGNPPQWQSLSHIQGDSVLLFSSLSSPLLPPFSWHFLAATQNGLTLSKLHSHHLLWLLYIPVCNIVFFILKKKTTHQYSSLWD